MGHLLPNVRLATASNLPKSVKYHDRPDSPFTVARSPHSTLHTAAAANNPSCKQYPLQGIMKVKALCSFERSGTDY